MDRGGREQRDGGSRPMGDEDMNRRSRYPDNQQLFVGNLPHTISEIELISYFESKLSTMFLEVMIYITVSKVGLLFFFSVL